MQCVLEQSDFGLFDDISGQLQVAGMFQVWLLCSATYSSSCIGAATSIPYATYYSSVHTTWWPWNLGRFRAFSGPSFPKRYFGQLYKHHDSFIFENLSEIYSPLKKFELFNTRHSMHGRMPKWHIIAQYWQSFLKHIYCKHHFQGPSVEILAVFKGQVKLWAF